MPYSYLYGTECERYQYITIPKVLLEDEKLSSLSCQAKLLYGVMLDRTSLSIKNKWIDKQNRVYIICSIEQIMDVLKCSKPTACKTIAELDTYGLIERRKRGMGLTDIIYVKDCMSKTEHNVSRSKAWVASDVPEPETPEIPETPKKEDTPVEESKAEKPKVSKQVEKYGTDFERFWSVYPRPIDKGNAYKKFSARIKDGYSAEQLITAAERYAMECKKRRTEKEYIKHPKTFLADTLPFTDYLPKQDEILTVSGGNPFAEYGD